MKASIVLIALLAIGQANAQTQSTESEKASGETKSKLKDVQEKSPQDIDEEITNARMRADAGSKSKYSVSTTISYLGGTIKEPFSENRANPTNNPTPDKVRMGGDIGVRYRINKSLSTKVGTGFSVVRPFHGMDRMEVNTPSIGLDAAYKIGGLQNLTGASVSYATEDDEVRIGSTASVGLGHTILGNVGESALTVGLAGDMYYTHYVKDDEMVTLSDGATAPANRFQQDYGFAFYPFMEYAFSDRYQFRTVFRPWIFSHARNADSMTFVKRPWTQSMGLTIVLSRDVYLYPNVQWIWEDWRAANFNFFDDKVASATTVGLQATLNVF